MTKSFKKTLSVLLSFLLIAFCFPFSAFAASTGTVYGIFLDDVTNEPIKDLIIRLETDTNDEILQTTQTDENGKFAFTEVETGEFYRVVVADGSHYVPAETTEYTEDGGIGFTTLVVSSGDNTFFKGGDTRTLSLKKSSVVLTKTSLDTANPVSGAVYELFDNEDMLIATEATDSVGKITVDNLPYGQYYFKEKEAPSTHFVNEEKIEFSVTTNGAVINVTAEDEPKGSLVLTKTDDETGVPLEGVVYEVYTAADKIVGIFTTDENGQIFVNGLHMGDYYYVEVSTIENYILDTEHHNFSVTGTGYAVISSATNTHYPDVTIKKVSSYDNSFVEGASLTIVDADHGSEVDSFVTTAGEYHTFLAPGNYILKEVLAPAGYEQAEDVAFSVVLNEENVVTMVDSPVIVTFDKFYEDANGEFEFGGSHYTRLPYSEGNADFTFVNVDDNSICYTFSADNTTYTLVGVPEGEYTLTEVNVNSAYEPIAPTICVVDNVVNGGNNCIEIYNDYKTIDVDIKKVDSENNDLLGAKFSLTSEWGTSEIDLTDSASATLTLKPGTYTLTETKTPDGYISYGPYTFTIDNESQSISSSNLNIDTTGEYPIITVQNDPTMVTINKVDSITRNTLKGVTFELQTIAGDYIRDIIIDGTPITLEGELIPGDYQLVELDTPYGYAGLTSPYIFTVAATTSEQVITVENTQLVGNILINKKGDIADSISSLERIAGFTENIFHFIFGNLSDTEYTLKAKEDIIHPDGTTGIIYADGETVATVVTDLTGVATIENLPFGTYTLVETKAKHGYVIDTTETEIIIDENHGCISPSSYTFFNVTGSLQINVTKKDACNNLVENAVYGLFVANEVTLESGTILASDSLVATAITDSDGNCVLSAKVPYGDYYVKEIQAPAGYRLSNTIHYVSFDANDIGTNSLVVDFFNDVDEAIVLTIKKTDTEDNFVPGAKLTLVDNVTNTVYAEWTTAEVATEFYAIPEGNYTLYEDVAPAGFRESTHNITFNIAANEADKTITLVNEKITSAINIHKTDVVSGNPLQGVKYEIINETAGKVVGIYTTDENGNIRVEDLPVAIYNSHNAAVEDITYSIIEFETLAGYVKDTAVYTYTFGVLDNTVDTISPYDEITLNVANDFTKLKISKIDITSNEELPGATLSIYKANDIAANGSVLPTATPYATWVSNADVHYIEKIPIGDYVLIETSAPDGYIKAESISFSVLATGDIQTVTMADDYTKVRISKTDIASEEELPGAQLAIYKLSDFDENGQLLESATPYDAWTSTTEAHYIDKMPVGEYVLIETTAPEGYVRAENISFSVEETAEIQTIVMKNDYTKLEISKVDKLTGEPLAGAGFALINVDGIDIMNIEEANNSLFVRHYWESTDEAYLLTRIPVGNYILLETYAPEGYFVGEIFYTIEVTETAEMQSVTIENEYLNINITKADEDTKEPLAGVDMLLINGDTPTAFYERLFFSDGALTNFILDNEMSLADTIKDFVNSEKLDLVKKYAEENGIEYCDELAEIDDAFNAIVALAKSLGYEDDYSEIANAVLKDCIIDSWTTTTEAHHIERFAYASSLLLIETAVPEGYERNTFTLELEQTGDVQNFTVYNAKVPVDVVIEEPEIPDTNVAHNISTMTIMFLVIVLSLVSFTLKTRKNYK